MQNCSTQAVFGRTHCSLQAQVLRTLHKQVHSADCGTTQERRTQTMPVDDSLEPQGVQVLNTEQNAAVGSLPSVSPDQPVCHQQAAPAATVPVGGPPPQRQRCSPHPTTQRSHSTECRLPSESLSGSCQQGKQHRTLQAAVCSMCNACWAAQYCLSLQIKLKVFDGPKVVPAAARLVQLAGSLLYLPPGGPAGCHVIL